MDYQKIYDLVHTKCPEYGSSKTRCGEFVLVTHDISFSSAIDVGCGQGQLLKWLRYTKPNATLAGIDISQIALDKIDLDNVTLKQGTAQNIPFEKQFDLVICTDVLEHIPEHNIAKTINELMRVTSNYICIQVEDSECIEDQYLINTEYDGITLHETRHNIHWWEHVLKKHNLCILKKQSFASKMMFLCQI